MAVYLPVRQSVLSVPTRLRYFLQRRGAVLSMVLRISLRIIAQNLQVRGSAPLLIARGPTESMAGPYEMTRQGH